MLRLSAAIHHRDIRISATLAESPRTQRCFRLFSDRPSVAIRVVTHLSPSQQRAYNLPSQGNQNKLGCAALPVCHHYKSSSWPPTCTSTLYNKRPWENNVCSQGWSTSTRWYTVRRAHSHVFLTRLLYGGARAFYNHRLEDVQGLGLALVLFHYTVSWLWTSESLRLFTATVRNRGSIKNTQQKLDK